MARSFALLLGVASVTTLGAVHNSHRSGAPREPARTVWDSVYTDSQAVSGDTLYKQNCVKCHGPTLAGVDDGSPLTGAAFLSDWDGKTVRDLTDRVRTSMPPDNPKSIPRATVTTIVTYLLAQNHFPAGHRILVDDPDSLSDIKILTSKP